MDLGDVNIKGYCKILSDTEVVTLGAGSDMSVGYDGTKGNIRTDLVAPSDLNVDCGAGKTIVLESSVWDDFPPVPIINSRLGSSPPTFSQ